MDIRKRTYLLLLCTIAVYCDTDKEVKTEEDLGVKYASRCEVCKVLATELQDRLEQTGKVHEVIEIGYSLDDVQPKKKTQYRKSELRLIESLDRVCEKILQYNIHKERQDSTRFAKGMSQTFKTLHSLVDKGVKVDLGIPYELWDKPSAEITHLKTQCESLLEENEEAIEDWYWNFQGAIDLQNHLCAQHALKNTDNSCLLDEIKEDYNKKEKQEKKPVKAKLSEKNKQKLKGDMRSNPNKDTYGDKDVNKDNLKGETEIENQIDIEYLPKNDKLIEKSGSVEEHREDL